MLDQHVMFQAPFADMAFVADNDETYASTQNLNQAQNTADLNDVAGTVDFTSGNISDNYSVTNAWYVDQLPPFDAVVIAANEYGQAATMRIYGIEILNEGTGFSIDDVVIDSQMTYVCRTVLPWQKLGSWDFVTKSFQEA